MHSLGLDMFSARLDTDAPAVEPALRRRIQELGLA